MKKQSAFNEARPRTARAAARQREIEVMKDMEELVQIGDENEYKAALADLYGISPGHPRYEKAMVT